MSTATTCSHDSTLLVRHISHLATFGPCGELKNAAIYVRANIIEWVGLDNELPEEYIKQASKTVDLSGCVCIPGLINTHAHMFQSLTRCIAQDKQLHGWLKTLYPIWSHLTASDLHIATKLSMVELVMSGCTTSSDHCYIFPNDCRLDDTIRAAKEVGIRFVATRGGMSIGISKGGIAPDSCVEKESDILQDAERCIQDYHDNSRFSMLRIAIGPSSQKVVSDELMIGAAELARRYPGVRLHTHLAENQEDVVYAQNRYGYRFKKYIQSVGWDKSDCWFAHCCVLDEEEEALFAERGIGIAHCPSSNTRLASGIARIRPMLNRGINIGIGVDGAASNDSQHVLMETRLAMLLQRSGGNPTALSAREALIIATQGGAKNLGREGELGVLAPGYAADFVAWKVHGNLGFTGSAPDPVAALLLCAPSIGFVNFSCINGNIIVQDGVLQTADIKEVIDAANAASERLQQWVTHEALGNNC